MNEDQIKDSLHQLAAAAPQTDIWANISTQVVGEQPRCFVWPHFRLSPRITLVGLNAAAIALLLMLIAFPTLRSAVSPNSNVAKPGNPNAVSGDREYPLTLARFAQLRAGKAGGFLPTIIPATYQLTNIYGRDEVAEPTYSSPNPVTTTLRTWTLYYHRSSGGYDKQDEVTIEVDPQAQIIHEIDQRRHIPQGLDAIGKPQMYYEYQNGGVDTDKLTNRYVRADRVIELYHDSTQAPRSQFAVVYFDNKDKGKTLSRFFIQAHTSLSNEDLVRLTDSLELINLQHLERYQ